MQTEFKKWMHKVDEACQSIAFLSIHDLPDKDYWDWFDAGDSPRDTALWALAEEGFLDD